ncbi:MAG: hypothetical protein ACLPPF_21220 [Rhodomicrobium sp.]
MTAPPSQTQKAGDTSPYASLRPSLAADAQDTQAPASASPGFTAELAKLQELREALWQAFKAGPDAGLPTILIELANSYTNSLRLQLNLKALDARKLTPSPPTNQPGAGVKK